MRLVLTLVLLIFAGGSLAAMSQDPPRRHSREALRQVVRSLTAESQDAMREEFLRHPRPNAAERFNARIAEADLQQALTDRQHRDPFIDAYIRWQLTSFDVDLPEMSPQQFARFMEQAPPMMENPRGSEKAVTLFSRAADAGPLSPSDLAHLREINREMDRQSRIAEALSTPAVEFRSWVDAKLETSARTGHRLLWMLENCAATINGAWSAANIKRRISTTFSASANDPSITADDRRAIEQQTQRLVGLERRFIRENDGVTFLADGSVRVAFSTAGVTQRDVENWIERLAGER